MQGFRSGKAPNEQSNLIQSLNEWFKTQESTEWFECMEWQGCVHGLWIAIGTTMLFAFSPIKGGNATSLRNIVENNLRASLANTEMLHESPEDEIYQAVIV